MKDSDTTNEKAFNRAVASIPRRLIVVLKPRTTMMVSTRGTAGKIACIDDGAQHVDECWQEHIVEQHGPRRRGTLCQDRMANLA
jgi:hypothetical protein